MFNLHKKCNKGKIHKNCHPRAIPSRKYSWTVNVMKLYDRTTTNFVTPCIHWTISNLASACDVRASGDGLLALHASNEHVHADRQTEIIIKPVRCYNKHEITNHLVNHLIDESWWTISDGVNICLIHPSVN